MRRSQSPITNEIPVQGPLWVLRNADLQSVGDQPFNKMMAFTNYAPTKVVAVRKTGAFAVTCIGGIYTGPGKTGNAIVSALQTWANLIGVGKIVDAVLAAIVGTDVQNSPNLYLSLTTGNLIGLTADLFVFGVILD